MECQMRVAHPSADATPTEGHMTLELGARAPIREPPERGHIHGRKRRGVSPEPGAVHGDKEPAQWPRRSPREVGGKLGVCKVTCPA